MRRMVIGVLGLVLISAAATAYRFRDTLPWINGRSDLSYFVVSGNIEAHESILSFKTVQSRIVELPFDEGQSVKARTVLARVDDADYKQQVEIAQAALNAQKKQLDVAEQNVDATRRTVVSDEADVALKQLEFDRAQTLLTKGAGTVDARDIAETALKQSRAALERDKALEAQADKSVALAIANIDSARATTLRKTGTPRRRRTDRRWQTGVPLSEAPSTDVVLHPLKADILSPIARARSLLNGGMASSLGLHPAARRHRHRRIVGPQTAGVDVERT